MNAAAVAGWVIALALAYVGLVRIAMKAYSGRFRPQAVVIAILAAFTIGFAVSRPEMLPEPVPSLAPAVPAAAPVTGPVDAGARCASARFAGAGGKGHLDTVKAGTVVVPAIAAGAAPLARGQSLVITGWAAAPDLKQPASAACLVLDGKIEPGARASYGTNRPDVARALHNPNLIATGFALSLPAESIPAGSHTVAVASLGLDGSAALLPGEVRVAGPAAASSQ